jgi:hypothetical protein
MSADEPEDSGPAGNDPDRRDLFWSQPARDDADATADGGRA